MNDSKHKKQLKRNKKKKKEKALAQQSQQRMNKRMNMFDKMPKACSICSVEFPLTQEAHMSWQVAVRNSEELVRIFCPDCQEKARELVEGEKDEL